MKFLIFKLELSITLSFYEMYVKFRAVLAHMIALTWHII